LSDTFPTRPAPYTMAQALPDELERVIVQRERRRAHLLQQVTEGKLSVNAARADEVTTMMTAAIDSAKAALASGDVLHVLQVHHQLLGFPDDR